MASCCCPGHLKTPNPPQNFMFYKGSKLPESMEDLFVNYKTQQGEETCSRSCRQGQKQVFKPRLSGVCCFHSISLAHWECKLLENRDSFPLYPQYLAQVLGIEEVLDKYLLNKYINSYYCQVGIVLHRLLCLGLGQTTISGAHWKLPNVDPAGPWKSGAK